MPEFGRQSKNVDSSEITDEMLRFRENFDVREHLKANPQGQSAPPPPNGEPSAFDPRKLTLSQLAYLAHNLGFELVAYGDKAQNNGYAINREEKYQKLVERCNGFESVNHSLQNKVDALTTELAALKSRKTKEKTNGIS